MAFFSSLTKRFSSSASREEPAPTPEEKVVTASAAVEVPSAALNYEVSAATVAETAVEEESEAEELPFIEVPEEYNQDDLLRILVANKGSDLHLSVGEVPMFRISGDLHRSTCSVLTNEKAKELLTPLVSVERWEVFEKCGNLDFAYEIPEVARFRGNFFKQKHGLAAVFREIPSRIPTIDEMHLPEVLKKIAMFKKGIVLVTGPTGSGKSTTMAAMLDYVNKNRGAHIITIEDPIEFTHKNRKCIIDHREVGTHANTFAEALRASLREDPDIVLVGEMRDLDTIYNAIKAAETGALVFGTLHTNSAAKTIDRIIDVFPAKQQETIRAMLSESIEAVVAQLLLKKIGGGRVAVHEILISQAGFSNIIREGKTSQINNYIQTGKDIGMQTMDSALLKLLKDKVIDKDTAREVCHDPSTFRSHGFDLSK